MHVCVSELMRQGRREWRPSMPGGHPDRPLHRPLSLVSTHSVHLRKEAALPISLTCLPTARLSMPTSYRLQTVESRQQPLATVCSSESLFPNGLSLHRCTADYKCVPQNTPRDTHINSSVTWFEILLTPI